MNEPRVVESVTNECQSLGRAHESSSARAEQLIACLEGEIAKRDARIVELEARIVWLECESQVSAAPVSEAKAQGVEQVQWHVRYLQAETVSDGWWQDSSEQRAAWCAEANQQQHAKGLPDTWEIRRFTIAAPVQQVSVPDERANFESEYLKANYPRVYSGELSAPPIFGQTGKGEYEDDDMQKCWIMWQARAMLAAPAAQAADAWIPVSERLPNIAQEVIVHSEFDGVCAGVLDSYGEWFAPCSEYKLIRVTSWMPMPTKIEANRHDQ